MYYPFRYILARTFIFFFPLDIIVTFSKLSKEAVFNIKENGINMINNSTAMSTSPFLWATIDQNAFFSQFSMNGVDDEYNAIWLALNPGK